jgi:hypothetical protein
LPKALIAPRILELDRTLMHPSADLPFVSILVGAALISLQSGRG